MTSTSTPNEKAFVVFPRGTLRDRVILHNFRAALRTKLNPANGRPFTDQEIERATAPGSRFWLEADGIDMLGQANQQRAMYLAAQADPRRANTQYLEQVHAQLWLGDNPRLPAVGAGGTARASGRDGTVITGSSTIGDPSASVASDGNGVRFQVLQSVTIQNRQAVLQLRAVDGGATTRVPAGTALRWSSNTNPGTDPDVIVTETLDGGFDQESDADLLERVIERMRLRPASGNVAAFMIWAREASVAVKQAFVYPCALQAGSVVVAVLEKRGPTLNRASIPEGPLARVPSITTLLDVSRELVPPGSSKVPERVFVAVTSVQPQPVDVVLKLGLAKGTTGGWVDSLPWPQSTLRSATFPIAAVASDGLTLTVQSDSPLPGNAASATGTEAPSLMLFNAEVSRWIALDVLSVIDTSPGSSVVRPFQITLGAEPIVFDADGLERPTPAIQPGQMLSPRTGRADEIAHALEAYFDDLGPGELVDGTAPNAARAVRQPRPPGGRADHPDRTGAPGGQYPMNVSPGSVASELTPILQSAAGAVDIDVTSLSRTTPDVAVNAIDGPHLLVMGRVSLFPR